MIRRASASVASPRWRGWCGPSQTSSPGRPDNETKRAHIGKASGYTHRSFRPFAVHHMYVTSAPHRPVVIFADTRRDEKETARQTAFPQLAGRFRRVWQVLGSNQRRLSRRFYRPLLPAPPYALRPAQIPLDEGRRNDAVRYTSVPVGAQPLDRTDSHGHCPRSTLTSTNLKAGPSRGQAAHRTGRGGQHTETPTRHNARRASSQLHHLPGLPTGCWHEQATAASSKARPVPPS
jgi:hypothetical protein